MAPHTCQDGHHQKAVDSKCPEDVEAGSPDAAGGTVTGVASMGDSVDGPQKLRPRTTSRPSSATSETRLRGNRTPVQKDIGTHTPTAAPWTEAKAQKHLCPSTDECTKKTHAQNTLLSREDAFVPL